MTGDVVAIGAVRTPIGGFGGALKSMVVYELGAISIRACLERTGIEGDQVAQVIYANCRQAGNAINPARTASVKAGIPIHVPAYTINMACPSGIKTAMLAGRELAQASGGVIVTGGMESMSTMPYLLKDARWDGFKLGDKVLMDSWSDTVDPLCDMGMGLTAENLAEKYDISREEQDAFALESQTRAAAARAAGELANEIVPVTLPPDRESLDGGQFSEDENIRANTSAERLAKLRPVFKKDGTVTAGNACAMGDAASTIILTTRERAGELGIQPLFSILGMAETAVEPATMGEGPARSIPLALEDADMTLDDMDFIEVNEAFAVQILANERALGWDRDRLNVFGGSIALGHPTGFTGARLLVTLDNQLRSRDKELGIAAICGGGGVSAAMVIRRES
jgi:acetyl-CoA C-acetyltransferase